ncbi:LAQU0S02e10660g1_1 [Lachancea quebecensis]|uniref:LAQU0S02e10660g1_1 n=1 Tax=Lachancea quebecensis TaxID=1654605 RepID=A0A0P1KP63_9SACH|nr:LAQU0S02e10660g1_1 [Lachancea quebecensis]
MGLCASKEDRSQGREARASTQRSRPEQKAGEPARGAGKSQAPRLHKKSGAGKALSNSGETDKDVSAKRAAGKAAAERFEKSQKQLSKGELGKKLAEERAKTHQTHLKETAETRQSEKDQLPVYD